MWLTRFAWPRRGRGRRRPEEVAWPRTSPAARGGYPDPPADRPTEPLGGPAQPRPVPQSAPGQPARAAARPACGRPAPGGAGGLLAAPGRLVPRLDPDRGHGRRHRRAVRGRRPHVAVGRRRRLLQARSTARSSWSSWPTSPGSTPPSPASRSATRFSGSGCWTPTPAALPLSPSVRPGADEQAPAIAFFVGYLWMLWEPRKRTWHDIVADSLVVRTTHYPTDGFARPVR